MENINEQQLSKKPARHLAGQKILRFLWNFTLCTLKLFTHVILFVLKFRIKYILDITTTFKCFINNILCIIFLFYPHKHETVPFTLEIKR